MTSVAFSAFSAFSAFTFFCLQAAHPSWYDYSLMRGDWRIEGIKSALCCRNFCTFTGLFLIHILKPRLGQKHSSCPQNHFALSLFTAGLSYCKFCFKNDEKMAKREIKWPGIWLCTKIAYQNMNLELYCQEFKRAISMCLKDRKK